MAEKKQSERVVFWAAAGTRYPTDDGRYLRVGDEEMVEGKLSLRNETRIRDRDEDDPLDRWFDILTAELTVADAEGRLWRAASHFSTRLLETTLTLSGGDRSPPVRLPAGRKPPDFLGVPRQFALQHVIFGCDDRTHRIFTIRAIDGDIWKNKLVQVSYKYLCMEFDIGFSRPTRGIVDPSEDHRVVVRMYENLVSDVNTGEDIGPLVFGIDWLELFRHNHYWQTKDGAWECSGWPLPLVFRAAKGRATKQPNLTVE